MNFEKLRAGTMNMTFRKYPAVLKDYGGEIVMVGISYDARTKEHSCLIERV